MSKDEGQGRIAALEVELARIQSERALMNERIRRGPLEVPEQGGRRADVLAWGAFCVAAALVTSLLVVVAQQQPVVHERTRVETRVVPDLATGTTVDVATHVEDTSEVVPEVAPSVPRRTSTPERQSRTTMGTMTHGIDDDRCGRDPTCGI